MLTGTEVLWKQKEDYYELMCQLVTRGRRAFFKEKQNEPRSAEYRLFAPEGFTYFNLQNEKIVLQKSPTQKSLASTIETETMLTELTVFGFLDSAMGASSRGHKADLAAIATVGIDRYGYCYVLDMWSQRVTPTQQVKRIFELNERWSYRLFGVEANCFQALLLLPIEEERQQLKAAGRNNWRLTVEPVTHKQNKISRIASLEPLITNGWLLFNERLPQQFFQQCRDFPESPHDDALDALEGAVALARRHSPLLNNLSRTANVSSRRSLKALNNF